MKTTVTEFFEFRTKMNALPEEKKDTKKAKGVKSNIVARQWELQAVFEWRNRNERVGSRA